VREWHFGGSAIVCPDRYRARYNLKMSAEKTIKIMGTTPEYASRATFDPAEGVFVAQLRRPPELSDVSLETLSPFLRALLVIDGTVTKFLEAYALEPVTVKRLGQKTRFLDVDHPWLCVAAGERIISRRVMLVGGESGRLYTYAESMIVPGRLPLPVQDSLEKESGGLGKILVDSALETRREGLWYGQERLTDMPEPVGDLCEGFFLLRSYRVIAGGVPLMLITERFPMPPDSVASFGRVPGQVPDADS
jgi:chorismate-pyruvate lyase